MIASAPASYNCVGWSGTFNGVPTFSAANGSVKAMAHGTVVGRPEQQPAKKQPNRPTTSPSAMPGANTPHVVQGGNPTRRMYHRDRAAATIQPPENTPP